MAALEEAISLCSPEEPPAELDSDTDKVFTGKSLQRKRDILVASAGARVRYRRKTGILFVDRDSGIHSDDCIRFEDRTDRGDLDHFTPENGERPRLFSPAFLNPVLLRQGKSRDVLVQEGRLDAAEDVFDLIIETGRDRDTRNLHSVVGVVARRKNRLCGA